MKKRTFIGKLLGQDEGEIEANKSSSSVTFERRPPAMKASQKGASDSKPLTKTSNISLSEREDMVGLMSNLPPIASAKLNKLNRARTDLAQMEQELSKSQRMFKLATDRMDEIGKYLEHSEVDLATLERLQPENEALMGQLNELKTDISRANAFSAESEARAVAIESKYVEAQKANEQYRQDAVTLKETIRSLKQTIAAKGKEVEELSVQVDELKDKLEVERDNAVILADKNSRIVAEMSTVSRKNLELEKRVEEVRASNKRNSSERESAQLELKSLRLEYASLRDTSIDKSARLEALQNELNIKERNFDESLKYRENEVFGLQSTLEDLNVQLRIKEEVSRRADTDLTDLKAINSDETKRRLRLEKELAEQQKQLEQNRDALLLARQNFDDLNRRLIDAQTELQTVKVINQQQAIKLEQYSAVGGVVVDFKKEASDLAKKKAQAAAEQAGPSLDALKSPKADSA